ncbi:MAG: acyl-CoA desaturase, partial [Actinomycetota bacterium]|nr:acyl-CoA desaturase [Actinomycetota bacterium]
LGYLHSGITGISYQWWVGKHNKHHANPNHEGEDPDIEIGVLAFSREQSWSKRGVARWITQRQAFLFFPLLLTEAIMLRIASVEAVARREIKSARLEGGMLAAHLVCYLVPLFLVLSPGKAVLFIVIHQGLMGVYLGCSFAPNHKGMPIIDGEKVDFLRKQVLTSRNVTGGPWVDYALGGLNYQIEHHLFPNMPRANLRRAQPLVRDYCESNGIPYAECGLLASYAQVLRHLHDAGEPLRSGATR